MDKVLGTFVAWVTDGRPRGPLEDDKQYVQPQAHEELTELPCRQLGLQQSQPTIRKVVI